MSAESTRDAVTAAFDQLEKAEDSSPAAPTTAEASPAPAEAATTTPAAPGAPAGDRPRDESGRFASKKAEMSVEPEKAAKPPEPSPGPTEAVPTQEQQPATTETKPLVAPRGWKPGAREKWAALPPEVKEEVARREREIDLRLTQTAKEREYAEKVRETLAPFEGPIRAQGGDPLRAVGASLQILHRLQHGSDADKAQIVAGLVKRFNVGVEPLAQALDGQPSQGGSSQVLDPATLKAQLKQELIQDLVGRRQQNALAEAQAELSALATDPAFEFFEDVRPDVRAQLQAALDEGRSLDVKTAYERACWANPEVRAILQQREAAKAAKATQAASQQAAKASTSVKPQPVVMGNGAAPVSTRDAVAAAWEKLAERR